MFRHHIQDAISRFFKDVFQLQLVCDEIANLKNTKSTKGKMYVL